MYDLIIVGGGPAGAAAAVYAARKQLKTLFLTAEWGGQSNVSPDIQNWIGTPHISGDDLAKALRTHVEEYAGDYMKILAPRKATSLAVNDESVTVTDSTDETHEAKTILITTGSVRRKLEVPGAAEFDNKGLTYCASCDGPLFGGKDVVVVGGGNAGFETAAQLAAYCKNVTILDRNDAFRADPTTVEKVLAKSNVSALHFVEIEEVVGEQFVTGIKWKHQQTGEETLTPVSGIFVEIGLLPNTEWVGSAVSLDKYKRITIDYKTQRAHPRPFSKDADARRGESAEGNALGSAVTEAQGPHNTADASFVEGRVWAAGDCTDILYHQNNIAAGDAVTAIEDIYTSLHSR